MDYLNISVNFGKYRVNDEKILTSLDQIQWSTKSLEKQIDKKIIQLISGVPQEMVIEPTIQAFARSTDKPEFDTPVSQPNRMILKFQVEQHSIEQTIQNLEEKFKNGGLSADIYIKHFRSLQSELFVIEKKLQALENGL